jgi:PIN domain nuclease of toxin-antitoxin system
LLDREGIGQVVGKIKLPSSVMDYIEEEGFVELPITLKYTNVLLSLENYHKDPFDKILIAQAKIEKLIFITRDEMILKYSGLKLVKA